MRRLGLANVIAQSIEAYPNCVYALLKSCELGNEEMLEKIKKIALLEEGKAKEDLVSWCVWQSRYNVFPKEHLDCIDNEGHDYCKKLINIIEALGIQDPLEIEKITFVENEQEEYLERLISYYYFSKIWEKMGSSEKSELIKVMNFESVLEMPITKELIFLPPLHMGITTKLRAFEIAMVVAVSISEILAEELATATDFGRLVRGAVRPADWFTSGEWLHEYSELPSYKVIIPFILHATFLRRFLMVDSAINIGLFGDTLPEKSELISALFGCKAEITSARGYYTQVEQYEISDIENIYVQNFPKFFDPTSELNEQGRNYHFERLDALFLVIDANKEFSDIDRIGLKNIIELNKEFFVALDKVDLIEVSQKDKVVSGFMSTLETEFGCRDKIFCITSDPSIKGYKNKRLDDFKDALRRISTSYYRSTL